ANTSKVRVNCINPQGTRTAMRAKAYPAEDPSNVPTAEQIMPLFLFLMGAESVGVNGKSLDARDK
ncbi:MAG TPA: YciK family oxidoreductase, partial [Agitococcus sp.]|nr:YciK family oxidoreductase [Agitococcus sp.]